MTGSQVLYLSGNLEIGEEEVDPGKHALEKLNAGKTNVKVAI